MNIYKQAIFHFFLFIAVFFSIQIIINHFYISESLLHEHLSQSFSEISVSEKMKNYKQLTFLQIIIPIVFYFFRFVLIATFISAVLFIYSNKIIYAQVLTVTILAEYVYIVKQIIRLVWFGVVKTQYTLSEFYHFNWDTIGGWYDLTNLENYFSLPLNTVNLFTILYVIVLAFFISKLQKVRYLYGLKITTLAFGVGLILWILFLMILLLFMS